MDHLTQIQRVKQTFELIDRGLTSTTDAVSRVPVKNYTDPDWLAREMEILFRNYPLFMGLSGMIAEPGDYAVVEHGPVPILLVRGDDGQARAFVNMCRHRGAPLAEGCGRARNFTCRYHAWSYDRCGALVGLPDKRNFPGIETDQHGLVSLPLSEWAGMIWVLPKPGGALNVEHYLAGMGPELRNYGLENYVHFQRQVLFRDTNWKMPVDTFLEPYHFAPLHANTVAPIFFHNLCLFEGHGPHHWMAVVRKSMENLRTQPENEWDFVKHTAISYQLFPNTIFTMQADHVETWRMFPVRGRVDQCVIYFDCYVPEPVRSEKAKNYWEKNIDLALRTVDEEDIAIQAQMERNYLSGMMEEVIIGKNEPALAYYHQALRNALVAG